MNASEPTNKYIFFSDLDLTLQCMEAVIDRTWEYLNIGNWDSVPSCYKDLYSYASLIKVNIEVPCPIVYMILK